MAVVLRKLLCHDGNNDIEFVVVNHDPESTATDCVAGSIIRSTNTNETYKKNDDGSSTDVTPWGSGSGSVVQQSSTSASSTASATYVVITGMTETPPAGTYLFSYSASHDTDGDNSRFDFAIHKAGVIVGHSERSVFHVKGNGSNELRDASTQAVVTVNGSEAVDVRFKSPDAATLRSINRSLVRR